MAFMRRTQSGRRYLSPIGAMPMAGVNHGDGGHAERRASTSLVLTQHESSGSL
jgi:hypothetical protein